MDTCLKLLDYMNSDDFRKLRLYGLEGKDYIAKDDRIIMTDSSTILSEKYPAFAGFSTLLDWGCMDTLRSDYTGVTPEGHDALNEFINESRSISDKQEFIQALTYISTPTKDKFLIFDNDDMIRVMLSKKPVEKIWNEILDKYNEAGLQEMIDEVNTKAESLGLPN
jgi:putative aldouronate transport system substrate-binding protein